MKNMNPKVKTAIIIIAVLSLTVVGVAAAATYLTSNHITHPEALPTPTPTPVPTTPPIVPTCVTLTTNFTDISTMKSGDYITFTAQLDKPVSGITITYYNNGTNYDTYTTDPDGKAVFTRGPFLSAFDVHVTATIP